MIGQIERRFRALLLRELLAEPGLPSEVNVGLLGEQLAQAFRVPAIGPWASAVSAAVRGAVTPPLERLLARFSGPRLASLGVQLLDDLLSGERNPESRYRGACQSAICHALLGRNDDAFRALKVAGDTDDSWARHHHLYGLLHATMGNLDRAQFELGQALMAEPYLEARERIEAALAVVRQAKRT